MNTNLHKQPFDTRPGDGGAWYQLRAERERICEALLGMPHTARQTEPTKIRVVQLQARLRLIDEALDRLSTGSYGDCVSCGRWIEDTKLHADPALPFCCACQQRSAIPAPFLSHFPNQLETISSAIRGLLRA